MKPICSLCVLFLLGLPLSVCADDLASQNWADVQEYFTSLNGYLTANQGVLITEIHSLNQSVSEMNETVQTLSTVSESIRGAVAFILIATALNYGSVLYISYCQRR